MISLWTGIRPAGGSVMDACYTMILLNECSREFMLTKIRGKGALVLR